MKRSIVLIALLVSVAVASLYMGEAHAQDEITPTPTLAPTPGYWQAIPVTSGMQVVLQRSITYGDIAVVISVVALLFFLVLTLIVLLPRIYLHDRDDE